MISGAMIVKNACASAGAALASLRPVCDELVVLDTGSTDGTLDTLHDLAATWALDGGSRLHVHEWPWRDDFSAARNEAAARCSGEWIVVLDADETMEAQDLRAVIGTAPEDADAVTAYVICAPPDPAQPPDRFLARRAYRKSQCQWRYPAHNQLVGVRRTLRSGALVHSSYRDGLDRRMARTVPILHRLYAEHPDDPHAPLFLARMFAAVCDHNAALRWAEIACSLQDPARPDPGDVAAWATRIFTAAVVHGPSAASHLLQAALVRYPQAPDLWHVALALTAAKWINAVANAAGTVWEIGTEWPIVGDDDLDRIQGAFDALNLGLRVGRGCAPK